MSESGEWIKIRGARTHNLQGLSVDIPRNRLTVISGPSGSGKSSLAFDTLFAEGRRRFLETLRGDKRALFRELERPDVDSIEGLPPVVCVSQHTVQSRPRSTLATITEIHDHLRLLYARFGTPYCPNCDVPIHKHSLSEIISATLKQEGRKIFVIAPLVQNQPGEHKDAFQHIRQSGFLRARVDEVILEIRDTPKLDPKKPHTIELIIDRLIVKPTIEDRLRESLMTAIQHSGGRVIITDIETGDWLDDAYCTQYSCAKCGALVPDLEPRDFHFNNPHGACERCTGFGQIWSDAVIASFSARANAPVAPASSPHNLDAPVATWSQADVAAYRQASEALIHDAADDTTPRDFAGFITCPECLGARLNRRARSVRYADRGLHEISAMPVADAAELFGQLVESTESTEAARRLLLTEIHERLRFLVQVGLGYLTLDRPAPTLSGGEAQRARLATHLGGGLLGICYILDEPTMGLHPRDTQRLLDALRNLQKRGNTLIVVEHDEAMIRAADWLIDIGPGAGRHGGRLLASSSTPEVLANPNSITAIAVSPDAQRSAVERQPDALGSASRLTGTITIHHAHHHNLKNITASFPLGQWTCVTGVSGSGKSSLVRDILVNAARRRLGLLAPSPGAHERIDGLENIDKILEVDQRPLGKSSRSNPASFVGVYDEIRKVFAATKLAKIRGFKANRFSFNVKGGRCEECQGQGSVRVEMAAMPDLRVPCPMCQGKRFNPPTLEVRYKGRSIADVLDMPIEEARAFFANVPPVHQGLTALDEVGLGYLALGQPASTLSGGEAQRVKLAAELGKTSIGKTLYVFDEPTTGLHLVDIARLIGVLRKLVAGNNTVIVIEHHPDLIAAADREIELGPEGGAGGGKLLYEGPANRARQPRVVS